jgi:hypothetical protein
MRSLVSFKSTVVITTVDLKETTDLYGRLIVLSRSSRDIDQKSAIGNYELRILTERFLLPDMYILLFSFLTGDHKLTVPLILSVT